MTPLDREMMATALVLARRALGTTRPNPAVGCVVAREGRALGRGWTGAGGRPHAETTALADAARRWGPEAARGATAYVTLEPCAHHGRTPPCADALVAAGVARVVSTLEDPDPRVSGRGFARLRGAGVEVEVGALAEAARALNAGFLSRHERGRPFVTLKLAASLDGRIAVASGESRWITGAEARARVHLMRARADAVIVGAGAARADDPSLDVRLPGLEGRRPDRVVVDGGLSLPLDGRLARGAATSALIVLHRPGAEVGRRAALAGLGATLVEAPCRDGGELDLRAALAALAARGIGTALCEGGGRLAAALLREGLVDEMVWMQAGIALGAEGVPAVGGLGLERLADAPRLSLDRAERLGADMETRWRPAADEAAPDRPGSSSR